MDAAHPLTRFARSAAGAATFFFALAVFMTWPLASGLDRNVPSDYGDPLYAAWAMAWVCHQLARAVAGDLSALTNFWNSNQLFPEPGTLAFSDHFVGQALTVAPVYWISGNPLLTLSIAYLIAFALSGLAMFLLVRDLTKSPAAGYFAGVILPFNEYIFNFEVSHLQVVFTAWMPLSLFALRRYFETGSRTALVGAGACLVMSNLSSGYYMLMFPPFVALYCAWELTARRAWRSWRPLVDLSLMVLAVALLTFPFVWPVLRCPATLRV